MNETLQKKRTSSLVQEVFMNRFFLRTVLWTTLVSDDNIPIALPTVDDLSPTAVSASLLPSPAEEETYKLNSVIKVYRL